MRNVTQDHTGNYDSSLIRHHTDTYLDCTNAFCLQMKGENVTRIKARGFKKHPYDKCRFPLYFILTARNAILSGGYLLPHFISVSIDFGGISNAGGYHC